MSDEAFRLYQQPQVRAAIEEQVLQCRELSMRGYVAAGGNPHPIAAGKSPTLSIKCGLGSVPADLASWSVWQVQADGNCQLAT